jgi:post-segregation antitoxin (ccd killing protein)
MIIYCGILLGNKKKVLLYIDQDVVTEVKDIGLNLSKTCENALKHAIQRLKRSDYSSNNNILSSHTSSETEVVVGVRRFTSPFTTLDWIVHIN